MYFCNTIWVRISDLKSKALLSEPANPAVFFSLSTTSHATPAPVLLSKNAKSSLHSVLISWKLDSTFLAFRRKPDSVAIPCIIWAVTGDVLICVTTLVRKSSCVILPCLQDELSLFGGLLRQFPRNPDSLRWKSIQGGSKGSKWSRDDGWNVCRRSGFFEVVGIIGGCSFVVCPKALLWVPVFLVHILFRVLLWLDLIDFY